MFTALRILANCALIVVLGWVTAGLAVRVGVSGAQDPEPDQTAERGDFGEVQSLESRQSANLVPIFGVSAVRETSDAAPIARNTTYVLRGLFKSPDGRSLAVLESSGETAVYRVGSRLPGGETIAEIEPASVVLEAGGELTAVAFERPEMGESAESEQSGATSFQLKPEVREASYTPPADATREQRPALSSSELEAELLTGEALSSVRYTRMRTPSGRIGLRIKWIRQDELTETLGLRRGDVVVGVNGVPVGDAEAMAGLLESIPGSREIIIDVERRDGPRRLVIPVADSS